MRTTKIDISQTAIQHNLSTVKQLAPNSKVLSMVKANAYGHGITLCLPALLQTDAFGVACMQEAEEVFQALSRLNLQHDIGICLIEGVFSKPEWIQAQEINAMCVIHHQQQLDWALQERFTKQSVWLKVNTGMNRLGFSTDDALPAYQQLSRAGYDVIVSMHFANADQKDHPINQQQITRFNSLLTQIEATTGNFPKVSACNSASIFNFPEMHYDWVRPGIMLYGSSPLINQTSAELNLRAAMKFTAQIFNVYTAKKGDSVGYGSTYQFADDTTIGIVSVGYGDGYPRGINNGFVICKQQSLPIIGRVSMDMLAVDLSNATNIQVNDEVELWGDNLSIDTIAAHANTISYELLCKTSNRPSRFVVKSPLE